MEKITYYKVKSPYPNDFTKNCSLNGIEIDENFLTLEGRDIKSLSVEGNYLVITLYNGAKIKGEISSIYDGYKAGKGIDRDKLNNEKIIETTAALSETTEVIRVTGTSVGSYNPGDVVPIGTDVQTILKKILTKVYDVTTINPTCEIQYRDNGVIVPNGTTYEVGTILDDCQLATLWTDGQYVGVEGYEYQENAGCNPLRTHYFKDGGELTTYGSPKTGTNPISNYDLTIDEGTDTFSCCIDYSQSQGTARKSDGSASLVKIPAGTTERASTTIKGAFKYYYGYIPTNYDAVYENIVTSQSQLTSMGLSDGWCVNNGTTKINYMQSVEGKTSLLLAIPYKYRKISKTENSMYVPVNVDEKWKQQTDGNGNPLTISYNVGQNNTTYYIYILHSLLPIRYNNIEFKKEG